MEPIRIGQRLPATLYGSSRIARTQACAGRIPKSTETGPTLGVSRNRPSFDACTGAVRKLFWLNSWRVACEPFVPLLVATFTVARAWRPMEES